MGTSDGGARAAISAENLAKSFGKIRALEDVALEVPRGTVTALLGPNGAGKTTFVRILATLLRPDSGKATVAGHDVVHEAASVRAVIGLTGQYTAVDENLTGRENLEMVARLYHLPRAEARARAGELLAQFELIDAAERRAKTYSGGMRRRLDLAASLVARPPILFLDEPTTGLDPRSRLGMWDIITGLVREGTTVLLTTQYLEEADRLADTIAVLDRGRIIKEGTSFELKGCCGGDAFVQVRIADRSRTEAAAALLGDLGDGRMTVSPELGDVSLPATQGAALLPEIVRRLDGGGIAIADISLRQPTLDDVFLALTGHSTEEVAEARTQSEGGASTGREEGTA
jgi:ABC-2 type transport system ATP-binding protein